MQKTVFVLVLFALVAGAASAMSVQLSASPEGQVFVGSLVSVTPSVTDATDGILWYRYRVKESSAAEYNTVRDFGPHPDFQWTASETDGSYLIEVTVRNRNTGETATSELPVQFASRVSGGSPVVSPTGNALVLLYSAPPCDTGASMSVVFSDPSGVPQTTPAKPCRTGQSMNFYVAGLHPNTTYTIWHTINTGSAILSGPVTTASTGNLQISLPDHKLLTPPSNPGPGVLLLSTLQAITHATDLSGNLIWYYGGQISALTRPEPGGRFLGYHSPPKTDPSEALVREWDLTGMTTKETNASRLNEQLAAMGKRWVSGFHHEVNRLPDGRIILLGDIEQAVPYNGSLVNFLGDAIIALDDNLQIVWSWDAFEHLDPSLGNVLLESCAPVGGGCPTFFNSAQAFDWLHGNSVTATPDGNILYSARHLDTVFKIDYNNGSGTGAILWKLGKNGDFQYQSTDPYPWFSHQHDPNIDANGNLLVYDNGNTRFAADQTIHSRGQVISLDEKNRTATLLLNVDLGAASLALGAAQLLPNGNYHFDSGWIADNGNAALNDEVDKTGAKMYSLEFQTILYRSFRMPSLYQP